VGLQVFGLTGGIGSGKSSVARHFRERGLPVVDADALARDIVQRGSPGLAEIAAAFGPEILDVQGELDRAALARRVFADPAQRAILEAITHPRVRALARARFAELDSHGEPLACYEVPLLFEAHLVADFHPIVVVSCSEAQQLERAMRRDGKPEAAIRARITAQMPLSQKARLADYVIDNSGSFDATRADADRVLAAICRERGVDSARYFAAA
jgi:dephospho-CoA kinase